MKIKTLNILFSVIHRLMLLALIAAGGFIIDLKAAVRPSLISRSTAGTPAGGSSSHDVSASGRYVVFASGATSLVAGVTDVNETQDVFFLDTLSGQIRCLSLVPGKNTTGNGASVAPIITPDGRYVVFVTTATNFGTTDANNNSDVYRFDTWSNLLEPVSLNNNGTATASGQSGFAFGQMSGYDISDDGRYVGFISNAADIGTIPDANGKFDAFLRDMNIRFTRLVSIRSNGSGTGSGDSFDITVSGDASAVAFMSTSFDLVAGMTDDPRESVFVRLPFQNTTRCMSRSRFLPNNSANGKAQNPVISKNGEKVVFASQASDIAAADTNNEWDVFVADVGSGSAQLASINGAGSNSGNGGSGGRGNDDPNLFSLHISRNARYVVFESFARDLTPEFTDINSQQDIFRRDLATGITELVSINIGNNSTGNSISLLGTRGRGLSSDGRIVTFASRATDITPQQFPHSQFTIFARDMSAGITMSLDLNLSGDGLGNDASFFNEISADGRNVVYLSASSNLTPNDTNGSADTFVSRIPTPRAAPADFDGDGRTDFSVFRPSAGDWYVLPSVYGFANVRRWGQQGDRMVPGDYDGDGKADHAVYRPSDNNWYVQNSLDLTATVTNFGLPGDIPAPADFDGDGKTNLAVFRPSNGTWYVKEANGSTRFVLFGMAGDVPVPADFDVDGVTDFVVYRPSTGVWYFLLSISGAVQTFQFGLGTDKLVVADYDGDSYPDLAVYRPSDATWYIRRSSTSEVEIVHWGVPGDIPVPGLYDGDEKTDIAVFRPSDGVWYIRQSVNGVMTGVQWGVNGDLPVPAAYLP